MTIDENGVEKEFSTKDAFKHDDAAKLNDKPAPLPTAEQVEH